MRAGLSEIHALKYAILNLVQVTKYYKDAEYERQVSSFPSQCIIKEKSNV